MRQASLHTCRYSVWLFSVGRLSKWLLCLQCRVVMVDAVLVFLYMPMCTFSLVRTHTHTHTCLSLFAVCFTIIANHPPALCSLHTWRGPPFHPSVGTTVCGCLCVYVCIVSCHARLEQCWSTGQADGIWPCPGVLWHIGMQDSKLSGQELVHMAVRILMCQHCICNSSSGVLSIYFPLRLPPPLSLGTTPIIASITVTSWFYCVGGVVCRVCKWVLLGLPTFWCPCGQ